MKKYAGVWLLLWMVNAHAAFEAIGSRMSAAPLDAFCLQEGKWNSRCADTQQTHMGLYDYLFQTPQGLIAIGFFQVAEETKIVAACRAHDHVAWADCSPDQLPVADYRYAAYHHEAGLIVTGNGHEGALVASCFNSQQTWVDCTPTQNTQGFYTRSAMAYAHDRWQVFSGTREWINGETIIPALCKQDSTQQWAACDVNISDPDQSHYHSIFAFEGLEYLAHEQRWIAVGMGGKNLFKSICRDDQNILWEDCTHGEFPSNGVLRLVQNDQGMLLQINIATRFTPDEYQQTSRILCRAPYGEWMDCSGSIKEEISDIYVGAAFDPIMQAWTLIGNHSRNGHTTYLTATQKDNDWQVQRQAAENNGGTQSFLTDIKPLSTL